MLETNSISDQIGKLLSAKGKTLAIAESCTGGYISHQITLIPGSSVYFTGGIIAYDNSVKIAELNVSEKTLAAHGAVSVECAKEMAAGILKKFNSDFSIATTGIAGPTGETAGKPVGTVCIACATKEKIIAERFQFSGDRKKVIEQSAQKALEILLEAIK